MHIYSLRLVAHIPASLEAATSRLEDLAASPAGPAAATRGAGAGVGPVAAGGDAAGPSSTIAAADPPAVTAFDDYLEQPLKDYAGLSEQIGGLVAQQVGR